MYKILYSRYADQLDKEVNEYLSNNYAICGGLIIHPISGDFYQVMVKNV